MVDVSAKAETARTAIARGRVVMAPATLALITAGTAAKGDVLGIARLAGIMAQGLLSPAFAGGATGSKRPCSSHSRRITSVSVNCSGMGSATP